MDVHAKNKAIALDDMEAALLKDLTRLQLAREARAARLTVRENEDAADITSRLPVLKRREALPVGHVSHNFPLPPKTLKRASTMGERQPVAPTKSADLAASLRVNTIRRGKVQRNASSSRVAPLRSVSRSDSFDPCPEPPRTRGTMRNSSEHSMFSLGDLSFLSRDSINLRKGQIDDPADDECKYDNDAESCTPTECSSRPSIGDFILAPHTIATVMEDNDDDDFTNNRSFSSLASGDFLDLVDSEDEFASESDDDSGYDI